MVDMCTSAFHIAKSGRRYLPSLLLHLQFTLLCLVDHDFGNGIDDGNDGDNGNDDDYDDGNSNRKNCGRCI